MRLALWMLLAVYAASRVLQIFPGVPMLAVVALHVVPPALFALFHGSYIYRWRGIVTFFAICFVVGNLFENLGVRTGFPFGHYAFTGLMGPKLFNVPVLLGVAYLGMAYLAWTLARLILGGAHLTLQGSQVWSVPLVAGFILTAWDLSMDPVWSTVLHAWIWFQGGPYFGVPVSNFLGWYLTVYVFFQLFALWLRGRVVNGRPLLPGYWHMPVVFYAVSAMGNLLLTIPRAGISSVSDPTGAAWRVSGITAACALVSLFMMGAFALIAWLRIDHVASS